MSIVSKVKKLYFQKWFPNWSPDTALRYLFIVKELKRDKQINSILDVGSGSLGITPYLKRKVIGADISFPNPKTHLLQRIKASADNLPFKDKSFDAVLCADVLEHIPTKKRNRVISELFRVAKKKIFIICPCGPKSEKEDQFFYYYTKKNTGSIDPFLEEHIQYGLPTIEEILSSIPQKTNITIKSCTNIYLHRIILLAQFSNNKIVRFISSVIFVLLIPVLLKLNFDPSYRKLIIISKATFI